MRTAPWFLIVLVAGCSSPPPTVDRPAPAPEIQERHTQSGWLCHRETGAIEWACIPDLGAQEQAEGALAAVDNSPPKGALATEADLSNRLPQPTAEAPPAPQLEAEIQAEPNPAQARVSEHLAAGDYAIQIIVLVSPQAVRDFAQEHELRDALIVPVGSEYKVFYALLLGFYSERLEAEAALTELPEEILSLKPWVRSPDSLREAMARAKALGEATASSASD